MRLALALVCCALLAHGGVRAEPAPVRDLAYGEGLFLYFKDDYFGAITRLLAAQSRGELSHHADDAELLLGGLHLSYGQQDVAQTIFERVLDGDVSPAARDRAWFYLGKIAWRHGDPAQAERALGAVGDALPEELAAERRLLLAQIYMSQERFGEAVAQLDDWEGPRDWQAYARYNLGVALVRHGRTEDGVRLLADISGSDVVPRARWKSFFVPWRFFRGRGGHATQEYGEAEALSDKANLALGYAYLQSGAAERAVAPLARVRADGPWASRAGLGRGWAHAALDQYDAALAAWRALATGDPLDAAVQEAHLAVPYALSRLEPGSESTIAGYGDAIAVFEAELARLADSERAIADGEFLDAVLAEDDLSDMSWFWQLETLPATAQTRHLYQVLATHAFQEGLKTYRDLRFLERNLADWRTGIDAFSAMLEARERRYTERIGRLEKALADDRLARLDARAQELAARVETIAQMRDALALADEKELALWARLDRVEQRLARLPDDATTAKARDRYRILRGMLRWQLEARYPERLWEQRKAVRALNEVLAEAHARRERLIVLRDEIPATFEGYAQRIDALAPRIDALRARVRVALAGQGDGLRQLALAEVGERRERLHAYLTEAQFALASVYDRAAHAEASQ